MGTEVALSFSTLRAQLENEKSSLNKIDESLKKIVKTPGRFGNDRFNNSPGLNTRGLQRPGGRNSFPDNNYRNEDTFGKRKHETKTVFSRLSGRGLHDSDGEEDEPDNKRVRVVSAVSRELPSRAAVLRAQGDDEQSRKRNRRMFGSLLGTLQKFKQEEIGLQTKEDKRAQVEKKIEEQARVQKEREQKERKTLFAEREHKKSTIKALEAKMGRVQEFEKWEESQRNLSNFILTKSKPHVYWIPKKMSEKAEEKLISSRKYHEKYMEDKRRELQEELIRIEQRCLRAKAPGAKENHPEANHDNQPKSIISEKGDDEGGRKRDKFAMDVDEKEDSDGEEKHEPDNTDVPLEEKDESQMDTTNELNTTIEQEETKENNETSLEVSTMDETQTDEANPPQDVQNSEHS